MGMMLVEGGLRTVPVLLVFFPHLSQSLSPANNLQQMRNRTPSGSSFHPAHRPAVLFCTAASKLKCEGREQNSCSQHPVQVNRTKQHSAGTGADSFPQTS